MKLNTIYNKDCMHGLNEIPSNSVDMIFCDLPYGITQNKWDIQIPLNDYIISDKDIPLNESEYYLNCYKNGIDYKLAKQFFKENKSIGLWSNFNRIIKDNGVIALWATGIFTSKLIESNKKNYRYQWIIEKTNCTGHLNAKKMPLKCHESVLIFYKQLPTYNPQKTTGHSPVHAFTKHTGDGTNYGKTNLERTGGGSTERYPRDVIKFKWDTQKTSLHPTQKPIDACKYFINTYTNEGDLVLDATCGSGSIPLAAKLVNRNYIGFEIDKNIYLSCIERLKKMEGALYDR